MGCRWWDCTGSGVCGSNRRQHAEDSDGHQASAAWEGVGAGVSTKNAFGADVFSLVLERV